MGTDVGADTTELTLNQHHEQRRTFALLDEVPREDVTALAATWKRLEVLLEVHAAEEESSHPHVLAIGRGASDADDAGSGTEDAIEDHDEIRDAVRRVGDHEVGSDGWWEQVTRVRVENGDHTAEEERQDLPDVRRHANPQARHDIAVALTACEDEHACGVTPVDQDPDAHVRDHG